MDTFALVIMLFSSGLFWVLICNHRTYKHRIAIIGTLGWAQDGSLREDWRERYRLFDQVSYEDHMLRLLAFRNPYVIYPPAIVAGTGKTYA